MRSRASEENVRINETISSSGSLQWLHLARLQYRPNTLITYRTWLGTLFNKYSYAVDLSCLNYSTQYFISFRKYSGKDTHQRRSIFHRGRRRIYCIFLRMLIRPNAAKYQPWDLIIAVQTWGMSTSTFTGHCFGQFVILQKNALGDRMKVQRAFIASHPLNAYWRASAPKKTVSKNSLNVWAAVLSDRLHVIGKRGPFSMPVTQTETALNGKYSCVLFFNVCNHIWAGHAVYRFRARVLKP